jgi:hypothetical protein
VLRPKHHEVLPELDFAHELGAMLVKAETSRDMGRLMAVSRTIMSSSGFHNGDQPPVSQLKNQLLRESSYGPLSERFTTIMTQEYDKVLDYYKGRFNKAPDSYPVGKKLGEELLYRMTNAASGFPQTMLLNMEIEGRAKTARFRSKMMVMLFSVFFFNLVSTWTKGTIDEPYDIAVREQDAKAARAIWPVMLYFLELAFASWLNDYVKREDWADVGSGTGQLLVDTQRIREWMTKQLLLIGIDYEAFDASQKELVLSCICKMMHKIPGIIGESYMFIGEDDVEWCKESISKWSKIWGKHAVNPDILTFTQAADLLYATNGMMMGNTMRAKVSLKKLKEMSLVAGLEMMVSYGFTIENAVLLMSGLLGTIAYNSITNKSALQLVREQISERMRTRLASVNGDLSATFVWSLAEGIIKGDDSESVTHASRQMTGEEMWDELTAVQEVLSQINLKIKPEKTVWRYNSCEYAKMYVDLGYIFAVPKTQPHDQERAPDHADVVSKPASFCQKMMAKVSRGWNAEHATNLAMYQCLFGVYYRGDKANVYFSPLCFLKTWSPYLIAENPEAGLLTIFSLQGEKLYSWWKHTLERVGSIMTPASAFVTEMVDKIKSQTGQGQEWIEHFPRSDGLAARKGADMELVVASKTPADRDFYLQSDKIISKAIASTKPITQQRHQI